MLRRRPERLLNVLSTLNLRPVSTGKLMLTFPLSSIYSYDISVEKQNLKMKSLSTNDVYKNQLMSKFS